MFVEEQGVPLADDLDGRDPSSTHFVALLDGEAAGTARLRVTEDGVAKVERVAVLRRHRGLSIGGALMEAVESAARELGHAEAVLGSQLEAVPFYEKRGWIAEGQVFLDAGLPHRWMRKRL